MKSFIILMKNGAAHHGNIISVCLQTDHPHFLTILVLYEWLHDFVEH